MHRGHASSERNGGFSKSKSEVEAQPKPTTSTFTQVTTSRRGKPRANQGSGQSAHTPSQAARPDYFSKSVPQVQSAVEDSTRHAKPISLATITEGAARDQPNLVLNPKHTSTTAGIDPTRTNPPFHETTDVAKSPTTRMPTSPPPAVSPSLGSIHVTRLSPPDAKAGGHPSLGESPYNSCLRQTERFTRHKAMPPDVRWHRPLTYHPLPSRGRSLWSSLLNSNRGPRARKSSSEPSLIPRAVWTKPKPREPQRP